MIKFILDAMYYQIFIFNRDKFILEIHMSGPYR